MKKFACIALGLLLVSPVWAEDESETTGKKQDPKGLEIVTKADAATKAVNKLQYHSSLAGWGSSEARDPKMSGDFWIDASGNAESPNLRVEAKGKQPQSEEEFHVTAGSDGENFFLVDHKEKIAYQDIDPAVMGSYGRMLQNLQMREFTHPTPFSDEINGDVIEVLGEKTVGGEPCHEIRVVYAGGQGEATWCFSQKDFLPRRREQKQAGQNGKPGGWAVEITNLNVSPKFDDKTFKLELPEGYEQSDDFAP